MTDQDKTTLTELVEAFTALPLAKQIYMIGYAEGAADTIDKGADDGNEK